MNTYTLLYIGKRHEMQAKTSLDAWQRGVNYFKVPKGRRHLISVVLADTVTQLNS